ncbi:MAG: hypothetical protein AABX29_02455 [Nanoarchaeota archaeon]
MKKIKIRNWVILFGFVGLLIFGVYGIIQKNEIKELNVNVPENITGIPQGAIHWHPRLTIIINNEEVRIPTNIGINIGKIVDTYLSGMRMSPTHTHEADGTIHLENDNPSKKPETLTLGYFFYVWGKQFNSSCVFEYCTDKGELKMYVNGEENTEFENYIMKDKDDLKLEYTSNEN